MEIQVIGLVQRGQGKVTESAGISGVDWNSYDFYSLPIKYISIPILNVIAIPQSV